MARLLKNMVAGFRSGFTRRLSLRQRKKFFICHCSEDHEFASKLSRALLARGFFVWFDEWELKIGDSIVHKISDAIEKTDFLLVILSPASIKSNWVREELNSSLYKQLISNQIGVLPILYCECDVPAFLKDKLYAGFRGDFDTALFNFLDRIPKKPNNN